MHGFIYAHSREKMRNKIDVTSYEIKDKQSLHFTKQIGRGTCATVFAGEYQSETVAIKKSNNFLYDDDIKNERDILLFLMSSNLSDFYVVKLLGYKFTTVGYLLVMELMSASLFEMVTTQKLNEENSRKVVNKLARGLLFLHFMNLVHRDIKPANILLDQTTFDAKFCDFNSSFIQVPNQVTNLILSGSPLYMAPELLSRLDEEYVSSDICNKAADIYSLSMTFWFIYSKQEPYPDCDAPEELVDLVVQKNHREEIPQTVPDNVKQAIKGGWFSEPAKRLTALQLVETLDPESLKY